MIIKYDGIYKNEIRRCYISEGYTDYNDLVIIMEDGTTISGDYFNNDFVFEKTITDVVANYVKQENKQKLIGRKNKIKKLIK